MRLFRKKTQENTEKITGKPAPLPNELTKYGSEPGIQNSQFFPGDGSVGLDAIYSFFQDDYETKGYNDALTNPDESYKADNIRLFNHDLLILIDRSTNYYDSFLKELDFHISSRSRAGLIDLVEELKIRKEIVAGHLEKIKVIEEDARKGNGATQRIGLSYQRGFMRGLSAISQSKMFKRNL